jgi:hypothetical protein
MNDLEKRFETTIENRKFTSLELWGFAAQPKLAVKAGMALGYEMAIDDFSPRLTTMLDGLSEALIEQPRIV